MCRLGGGQIQGLDYKIPLLHWSLTAVDKMLDSLVFVFGGRSHARVLKEFPSDPKVCHLISFVCA